MAPALGNTKTKRVVGYGTIIDSFKMTMAELKKHNDKHQAYNFLEEYAEGRKILFAWVLRKVKIDNEPKPYFYSTGSWCSYDKKLSVKD